MRARSELERLQKLALTAYDLGREHGKEEESTRSRHLRRRHDLLTRDVDEACEPKSDPEKAGNGGLLLDLAEWNRRMLSEMAQDGPIEPARDDAITRCSHGAIPSKCLQCSGDVIRYETPEQQWEDGRPK